MVCSMRNLQEKALLKSSSPLLAILFALSGCDSDDSFEQTNFAVGEGIEAPERIRESFAVDFAQVTGLLTINGQAFQMSRLANNQFQVQIPNIAANSNVTVVVEYSETLPDGRELRLGRSMPMTQSVGNNDLTINISNDQFDYSFDDDEDDISNIVEREQGTDPFEPENSVNRLLSVQFNIPQRINDPAITRHTLIVNGIPRATNPPDGDFLIVSTGVVVPSNFPVEIDVRLDQLFAGQPVPIAQAETQLDAGEEELSVVLTDQDFGFLFDQDQDGIINLDELENGTDPFSPN